MITHALKSNMIHFQKMFDGWISGKLWSFTSSKDITLLTNNKKQPTDMQFQWWHHWRKTPLQQPVNSRSTTRSAPSNPRSNSPWTGSSGCTRANVSIIIRSRGASLIFFSSQFCLTAVARYLMKLVATHSHPHTGKCPTSSPHMEKIHLRSPHYFLVVITVDHAPSRHWVPAFWHRPANSPGPC